MTFDNMNQNLQVIYWYSITSIRINIMLILWIVQTIVLFSFLILFRGSDCLFMWFRYCLDRQFRSHGVGLKKADTLHRIIWWTRRGRRRYCVHKFVLVHFFIHFSKNIYVSTHFTNHCVDIIDFINTLLRHHRLRNGLHL